MRLGIFFDDGDLTYTREDAMKSNGPPLITFPFAADGIYVGRSILFPKLITDENKFPLSYISVDPGTYPNFTPFSPCPASFVIEQEFVVYQENFRPPALNTPYNEAWSLGWEAQIFYSGGNRYPIRALSDAILVKLGPMEEMGGDWAKIKLTFAVLPQTRVKPESHCYKYPGYADDGVTRLPITKPVMSYVQYDYFVYDALNILDWALFTADPDNGRRLNALTGLFPHGNSPLILPEQKYYATEDLSASSEVLSLSDGTEDPDNPDVMIGATEPSFTGWKGFIAGGCFLIAEQSTMGPEPWMGNIWERKTRFVPVQ